MHMIIGSMHPYDEACQKTAIYKALFGTPFLMVLYGRVFLESFILGFAADQNDSRLRRAKKE